MYDHMENRVNIIEGIICFDKENQNKYVLSNNKSFCINNKYINCFVGDIVSYNILDGYIIKVISSSINILCGILKISSKVSYGTNKRGIPKKLLIPYDNTLPNFLVGTKRKHQANDIYVVIKFDRWVNGVPYGNIEEIIGEVGIYDFEKIYLKRLATCTWKSFKKINLDDYQKDLHPNRTDLTNRQVISIDPVGCKDIDDALHVYQLKEKSEKDELLYEIGIHIADVTSYIPYNSDIDRESKRRGESVYLNTEQIHMLPEELSTNIISLTQDKIKRAYTILIKITSSGEIIDTTIFCSLINPVANLSYEKADEIIKNNTSDKLYKSLKILFDMGFKLYNKKYKNYKYDIHKMVEIYMIYANIYAATLLVKNKSTNMLLRRQSGYHVSPIQFTLKKGKIDLEEVINHANIFRMSRAEYFCNISDISTYHKSIDEEFYTHYTSPIRRYADNVVHRAVYDIIMRNTYDYKYVDQTLSDYLNKQHKLYQECEKEAVLIKKIFSLHKCYDKISTYGYIVGFYDNKAQIYIPSLDIDADSVIFSYKTKILYNIVTSDDSLIITSKDNDKVSLSLKILDEVEIKVIITLLTRKKINLQMINPNPMKLFNLSETENEIE